MKRYLSFLLILTFLLAAVACNEDAVDEASSNDDIQSFVSETSEESIVLEDFVLSEDVQKINNYLKNEIDRSVLATNVFKGSQYKFDRDTDKGYPDNSFKLTDGKTVDVFDTNSFVGWKDYSPVSIDFDLGNNNNNVADITVGCLRLLEYGIGLPKYVAVQASDDGKEYTEIGRIDTPKNVPDSFKYEYSFAFPRGISARYIRIYCSQQDAAFLFIDEICAYDYNNGTIDRSFGSDQDQFFTVNDFYEYELNLGDSDVKVAPTDEDYDKEQNLAMLKGVEFQISHFDPLMADHTNTPKSRLFLLNDGRLHGNLNSDYFISQRGGGRHIVCDLGNIMSVSGATFSFYDRYTWGVSTPPAYYVSISENGSDWTTVYSYYNEGYGHVEKIEDTHNVEFADSYKARYVRLTFQTAPDNTVSSSVYLGEFAVIGKKNPSGAITAVEDNSSYGKYVSKEKYSISNLLFAPITDGYGKHCTDVHTMSEESAYIYLSRFDGNGNPVGVFMDSVAFSTRGALNDHKYRNEGMNWFFDELFYEGLNLDAIEKAKERLNKELGTSDKIKIWICVNAPAAGDIFNGREVKNSDQYNECIRWQVDEAIKRFDLKNYKNLELVGFYWQFETVRTDEDISGMNAFNEYVHKLGYLSLWCPYYNANGIWLNHQVGFDIACLQPNYMFYDTEPTRMYTTAELAKLYGMCVEIEIEDGIVSNEALKLYRDYLKAGYETGFMNSIKVYYQGGLPGAYVDSYKSSLKNEQAVYDETILYATEKLSDEHYKAELMGVDGFKDGELTLKHNTKSEINIGDLKGYQYRFVTTPVFGSVRLDEDGTLVYRAMKGYAGEDIIRIEIFDGVSETKIITVNCNVTKS